MKQEVRNRLEGVLKHSTKRSCKVCGIDISHRHALAKYCSEKCYRINKRELDKGYEENRPSRKEQYQHYNLHRRLGNGNVGPHLYTKDGDPDFDKEARIIKFEKKKILYFGNSQFNPVHGNGFRSMRYLTKEEVTYLRYEYFFHQVLCNSCNDGKIIIPVNPKSFDFDMDGFVMPFCSDCGVVYNE